VANPGIGDTVLLDREGGVCNWEQPFELLLFLGNISLVVAQEKAEERAKFRAERGVFKLELNRESRLKGTLSAARRITLRWIEIFLFFSF
jgi:hypothetical protein